MDTKYILKDFNLVQKILFKVIDGLNRRGEHTNPQNVKNNIRKFLEHTCDKNIFPVLEKGSVGVDIGAGYGLLSDVLAKNSITIYNLDKSWPEDALGIRIKGVAENLPFNNDSLDAALIFYAFNHFDNPKRAFSEAYRVIKKGGHIITMMEFERYNGQHHLVRLNEISMNNIIYNDGKDIADNLNNISRKEFNSWIRAHSLEVILDRQYNPTRNYDKLFKTAKNLYILQK